MGGASQVVLVVRNLPANAGDLRDTSFIPGSGRSPGGGHGNLLQYSCLENPMDRGVWRTMVHRVAKSCTWLKQLSNNSSIPLELIEWYMKERKYPRNTTESRIINVSPFGLTLLTLILITSQKNAQELCSGLLPCYTEESGSSDCFSKPCLLSPSFSSCINPVCIPTFCFLSVFELRSKQEAI